MTMNDVGRDGWTEFQVEAYRQREEGTQPIRLHSGEKRPIGSDWQRSQIELADVPPRFANCYQLGVLLGEASNGLVDVDLDTEEAADAGRHFLPATGRVFGRSSRPRSHYMYRVEPLPGERRITFVDPLDSQILLEIRSTGHQTMIPPSVHPNGEPLEWHERGE